MVQKYCPKCKDCIPVACKSCPCGHKFAKTVAESARKEAAKLETERSSLGRQENGRPQRRSAMNSLYYHSSLQLSSYKLAKQAVAVSARKRPSSDSTGASTSGTNGHVATNGLRKKKKKRGRPRIHPRPEEQETEEDEKNEPEPQTNGQEDQEFLPPRRHRPGLMSLGMRNSDNTRHPNDNETRSSRTGRTISESESYSKLYKSLSETRRQHFSTILAEINHKFKKNANFPL